MKAYKQIGLVETIDGNLPIEFAYERARELFQKEVISVYYDSTLEELELAQEMIERAGYTWIGNPKDILENESSRHTEWGRELSQYKESGKLWSDEMICQGIKNYIINNRGTGYVLYNYPNNLQSAKIYDQIVGSLSKYVIVRKSESNDEETTEMKELEQFYNPSQRLRISTVKYQPVSDSIQTHFQKKVYFVFNAPYCDTSKISQRIVSEYNAVMFTRDELIEGECYHDLEFNNYIERIRKENIDLDPKRIADIISRTIFRKKSKCLVVVGFPLTLKELEYVELDLHREYIYCTLDEDKLVKQIKAGIKPKPQVDENGDVIEEPESVNKTIITIGTRRRRARART